MRRMMTLLRYRQWRWIVAHAWDRLFPRSCWAETAAWAMGTEDSGLRREADGKGTERYCPDAANDPAGVGCWCGKFCPRREVPEMRLPVIAPAPKPQPGPRGGCGGGG
jgi:hypothetical protein